MSTIAVLVPPIKTMVEDRKLQPMELAVQNLNSSDILTVFGYDLFIKNNSVWINGYTYSNHRITEISTTVDSIYDRFPSQSRIAHFKKIYSIGKFIPFSNPYESTLLARDKVASQRILEAHGCRMPTLITEADNFQEALKEWGTAFLKPQYGAFGANVTYCSHTGSIHLPARIEGLLKGQMEPAILQRAIPQLKGWAGLSVRQLVQRDIDGSWLLRPAVLRRSFEDPVVNVARGAEAIAADTFLSSTCMQEIATQSLLATEALSLQKNGHLNVEFGLDFVIDQNECPWLIEVNSRPRGRLAELAKINPAKYKKIHQESCVAPIRFLATGSWRI